MTTIVAVQYPDKVVIGADSQVTGGGGRIQKHIDMAKITKRGSYLLAGSGEVAPCDIFQHIWKPPSPKGVEWNDLYHFVIAKVIPSLKQCFKEHEYKWDKEDDETKFSFLVCLGGRVFEISDDMSITIDDSNFYAVGSGSNYAIGALEAGATLEEALAISAKNDAYTSPPFSYFTQYDDNTIEEGNN